MLFYGIETLCPCSASRKFSINKAGLEIGQCGFATHLLCRYDLMIMKYQFSKLTQRSRSWFLLRHFSPKVLNREVGMFFF